MTIQDEKITSLLSQLDRIYVRFRENEEFLSKYSNEIAKLEYNKSRLPWDSGKKF